MSDELRSARGEAGFTLLELLIAVSLMAVLAVLGWRGLESVLTTRDRIVRASDAQIATGIVNAGLLWRYLIRQGVYQAQRGWPRLFLQIALGSCLMAAAVLYARHLVGDWGALGPWYLRAAWLLGVVGAGALAYGLGLLLAGVRPRQLREA